MPATAAMTPPVPLVLRSVEVRPESARLVVVAFVRTPLVVLKFVDVALVPLKLVAKRFVEVAFVDVLLVIVTPLKVEDAPLMMSPSVEVGVRAPLVICQLVNAELMKSTPAIA